MDARARLLDIITTKGLRRLDEPIELSSGELSYDFVDGKEALSDYADLEVACTAIVEAVHGAGIEFDAVGGLTLGADHLAVGIAAVARCRWFIVRKEPKGRGTGRQIEGARIEAGDQVLLVDDAVTSGGSILQAHEVVAATGATIVGASTLIDRSELAGPKFEALGVPYLPMATYRDLDIEPVGLTTS